MRFSPFLYTQEMASETGPDSEWAMSHLIDESALAWIRAPDPKNTMHIGIRNTGVYWFNMLVIF